MDYVKMIVEVLRLATVEELERLYVLIRAYVEARREKDGEMRGK